jgi:hypothetical protein
MGIKRITGTEVQQIGGLKNHRNAFFYKNFIAGDCRVTWGVVVVQHPSVCSV